MLRRFSLRKRPSKRRVKARASIGRPISREMVEEHNLHYLGTWKNIYSSQYCILLIEIDEVLRRLSKGRYP